MEKKGGLALQNDSLWGWRRSKESTAMTKPQSKGTSSAMAIYKPLMSPS